MKVVGIIPARYESSRFPGKPLVDLKGKTMIQRVYENASKANLDEIIVATDDERIFDHVKAFGGKVVMTQKHHTSGTERCGEVAKNSDADVVINIQGDEPLINPLQLNAIVEAFRDKEVQIATLGYPEISKEDIQNPNRIKIVKDAFDNALYFSRSAIPNDYHYKGDAKTFFPFLKHIGMYAFRKATLLELVALEPSKLEQVESLEQLRWLYYGYKIRIVNTTIETPNIDVPEDVEKVLKLL
ncbi:MAG: 3-deoxy-manno-octulosonate cytidylyltransferase [Crocinitomicaceae bacterium]|nr:3-deoxy-manno-octulosonate cytidylyltransferase [Crocinitomicaceae bacterium]